MKYTVIKLMPLLLLAACNGPVTAEHIKVATELCSFNGGVFDIHDATTYSAESDMVVKCVNGASIDYRWKR